MVKAKRIKELRKQVEKAERVLDPFERVRRARQEEVLDQLPLLWRGAEDGGGGDKDTSKNGTVQAPVDVRYMVEYRSSASDLTAELVDSCLDLFQVNMGELYRNSSFGLDLDAKRSELTHRKARYLLVFDTSVVGATAENGNPSHTIRT